MKRITTAIGAACLACVSHGALALDQDAVLDQFPSARPAAVDIQQARRGARTEYGRSVHEVRGARQAWPERRAGARYRSHGSFVEVGTPGGSVERGAFYGTAGTANAPGIIVINTAADHASLSAAIENALGNGALADEVIDHGPKILDVEADRLDRRPYGPDGLDVVYSGGAKIIRISPDFGQARARGASTEAPTPVAEAAPDVPPTAVYPDPDLAERPVDPPAPQRQAELQAPAPAPIPAPPPAAAPAAAGTTAVLEPWSPEWLRDCVSRYENFDASLGTYLNESGQRRFCTGEP